MSRTSTFKEQLVEEATSIFVTLPYSYCKELVVPYRKAQVRDVHIK